MRCPILIAELASASGFLVNAAPHVNLGFAVPVRLDRPIGFTRILAALGDEQGVFSVLSLAVAAARELEYVAPVHTLGI